MVGDRKEDKGRGKREGDRKKIGSDRRGRDWLEYGMRLDDGIDHYSQKYILRK